MVNKPINKPLSLLGSASEDTRLQKTHFLLSAGRFLFYSLGQPQKMIPSPPHFPPPFVSVALEGYNRQRLLNEIIPPAGEDPSGLCQALYKQPSRLELLQAA